MKLIKKLARKLLFSKKKQSPTPVFQAKPTTSANSIVEPVIKFEQPKIGGNDLDDKVKLTSQKPSINSKPKTNATDQKPQAKKPGRPKGQSTKANPNTGSSKKPTPKSKPNNK